jgi:UDPglucose--hexose-1-phosphate uridylyltransferase
MKPEIRHDPITGRPVLMAPERAARVGAMLASAPIPDDETDCPFCERREDRTPPELLALRAAGLPANGPGWTVRVVSNRYPAVRDDTGQHELIIECPQHEPSLAALSVRQLTDVLYIVRDRLNTHRADGRWSYAQWFKNHGPAAGASLSHAHSQLVMLPVLPPTVAAEVAAMKTSRCPFCSLIEYEITEKSRIVRLTDRFMTLTAFAGRFPFETWLLPRRHELMFEETDELAAELHGLLNRIDLVLDKPAYNLVLHAAPWTGDDFHWHLELLPRVTGIAGFELGAGMFINPVLPEEAAACLKSPPGATGAR